MEFTFRNALEISMATNNLMDKVLGAYESVRYNNIDPEQRPNPEQYADDLMQEIAFDIENAIENDEDLGEWETGFEDLDVSNKNKFMKIVYDCKQVSENEYEVTFKDVKTWSERK